MSDQLDKKSDSHRSAWPKSETPAMCEEPHPDGTKNLYCVKPPGHNADNHGEKHASPIGYWPETDEWEWVEWA